MKTKIICYAILAYALVLSAPGANAQAKLIQFMDFNNIYPKASFVNDSIGTAYSYAHSIGVDTTMGTAPCKADWAVAGMTDTAWLLYTHPSGNGILVNDGGYPEELGTIGSWIDEYDNKDYTYFTYSDTGFAAGNGFIKCENPTVGSYMYWYLPTNGYSDIYVQFCEQISSTNSAQYAIFRYSDDGGKYWRMFTKQMDTFNIGGVYRPDTLQLINPITSNTTSWYPCWMNMASDDSVNNNPNFVIRITFGGSNASGSSHNQRWDNVAVWSGNPGTAGVDNLTAQAAGYRAFPIPAVDFVNLLSDDYKGDKVITLYNAIGQTISVTENSHEQTAINTSSLSSGVYFIGIKEVNTGNIYTLKIVKQ